MKFTKKDLGTFVRITGVLLIITMSVAFLLSFVNGITKDTIAANEAQKTAEAVKALFPEAAAPTPENMNAVAEGDLDAFHKVKDGENLVGYYAEVSPSGFKGPVSMIIGLDTEGKIVGIRIISMSETVGIGDKIENESFLGGFKGLSGSVEADGISGATYSSKAVIAGANAATAAYAKYVG
jgi:electron transport complex protein RnfG